MSGGRKTVKSNMVKTLCFLFHQLIQRNEAQFVVLGVNVLHPLPQSVAVISSMSTYLRAV